MRARDLVSIRFAVLEVPGAVHEIVDAEIRVAPAREGWACRAGCAACCHLLVEVKPWEAELLVRTVDRTLSPGARAELAARAARIADRVEGLSAGAYRRARVRCAFLDESDRCVVYAVRPVKCRVHASRSADRCASLSGPVPLDTWLTKIGAAAHAGMEDAPPIELHRAFTRASSPK